jgi:hypothetical protein
MASSALKPFMPGKRTGLRRIPVETGLEMIRKIDDDAAGSMFQRALAEGAAKDGTRAESDSAAGALAGKARDGWDPYDVWVRHIHEPRRRATDS